MNKRSTKILVICMRVVLTVVLLIILLPLLLYVPPIQNWAKDIAIAQINQRTGLEVSLERVLIKFPLDISLDKTLVLDERKDTMAYADNVIVDVRLMPLFKLDIDVNKALLTDGRYNMVSEDSSLTLRAKAMSVELIKGDISLENNTVKIYNAKMKDGDISLLYDKNKVKPKPDTTKTKGWHIEAKKLKLENVRYSMKMLPYIYDMETFIANAELNDGMVDTESSEVNVRCLSLDSVSARYIYPTEVYLKKHPIIEIPDTFNTTESKPWRVKADSLRLRNSNALYALMDKKPANGLDLDYINVSDINISVDSFYNEGVRLIVPIKEFRAKERCGISINQASGTFAMDSNMMYIKNLNIKTLLSHLYANGSLATDFTENNFAPIKFKTKASIGLGEVTLLYPWLKSTINNIPQYNPVELYADFQGTRKIVNIHKATLYMKNYADVDIKGRAINPLDTKKIQADITFNGKLQNMNFVKPMVFDRSMQKTVNVPPLSMKGRVNYANNNASGKMDLRLSSGKMVFEGKWNGNNESYTVDATMDDFPVHSILPQSAFGNVTAKVRFNGKGYDIYSSKTDINSDIHLGSLRYNKELYNNITAHFALKNNRFDLNMNSHNDYCDMALDAIGIMRNKYYEISLKSDIGYIDLQALKLSETESKGQGSIEGYGIIDLKNSIYNIDFNLNKFNWMLPNSYYYSPNLTASIQSSKESIDAFVKDNDLLVEFSSNTNIDSFLYKIEQCQKILLKQFETKTVNIDTLHKNLPYFTCKVNIGSNNLLQQYLTSSNITFKRINLNIDNDSNIYIRGKAEAVKYNNIKLDTITIDANERNKYLAYNIHLGNRKGTNDEFANVTLRGGVRDNKLIAHLTQKNIKGKVGFRIGVNATLADSIVSMNFFPKKPIIGYRTWNVNDSNILKLDYINKSILANLKLESDKSFVYITSDSTNQNSKESDVNLRIGGLELSEWLRLSPFAPPVSGILAADMKLKYDGNNILGNGVTSFTNLAYAEQNIGDFDLNLNMAMDPVNNNITLNSDLGVNGNIAIKLNGIMNDSTSNTPFALNLDVTKFPLQTASAFIPGGIAKLGGYLNGKVNVSGSVDKPILSGFLECENGKIDMDTYGSHLKLSTIKIPIDSNYISLKNFNIIGSNNRPITVNGFVNLNEISNPFINLQLQGSNVEVVNSKQNKDSEVFGKGDIDIRGSLVGPMDVLDVDADISLLAGSNLTYVMQTDVATIATQTDEEMVRFVNFADSTDFETDSVTHRMSSSQMSLDALLHINQGSKFNVFLSSDGKDKVQINGEGDLNFSQTALGDMRLTGQYNIESGYVKYSPPLISEKLFNFEPGSNISWTGNMMNPVLNLKAVETLRANIVEEGQNSRLIDFLITCNVTNTLNNMNVVFDLSTNDDITVQNELKSMSATQRSSKAINLLLYNSYTGMNTSTNSTNLAESSLFSFLNSQINRWAANTISGVDLSFGINQYNEVNGDNSSKTTSYSYKISKSLFNDRFKIVIGGTYNPNASSEENFANTLLNDISFVYMLNKSGSMSVKIFRNSGYESVLEGEIIKTGGAFVIKRKLTSLKSLFKFKKDDIPDLGEHHQKQMPVRTKREEENDTIQNK